ncbi:MAG: hypothetical protein AAFS10_17500, partial [Myxococcota bacterium]
MTISPKHMLRFLIQGLALTWLVMCLVGCVDEDADAWSDGQQELLYSLSSGRTPIEEQLAGELEGLLPGDWAQADIDTQTELQITFLGHDAVTGDIAFLLEDAEVHPTRVVLSEDQALLILSDHNRSYLIEHLDADTLALQELETGDRFV